MIPNLSKKIFFFIAKLFIKESYPWCQIYHGQDSFTVPLPRRARFFSEKIATMGKTLSCQAKFFNAKFETITKIFCENLPQKATILCDKFASKGKILIYQFIASDKILLRQCPTMGKILLRQRYHSGQSIVIKSKSKHVYEVNWILLILDTFTNYH